MTTAGRVLDVARSQIGTVQASNGSNPYGKAYGMDRVAWCAQFVWWCFREAGAGALIPKTAYTPTLAAYYQQRGRADRSPRVGDLVLFDWPGDGIDRISHVGLVEAVNRDGTLTTIEGNTTSGTRGDQRMGGGVWRRARSTSAVVIYAHPAYDGAAAAAPTSGTYTVRSGDTLGAVAARLGTTVAALVAANGITDPNRIAVGQVLRTAAAPAPAPAKDPAAGMATLQYGMRSDSRVVALQRWLNAYDWRPNLPLLPPTGNYLTQTRAVVKAAQAQCGVTGADADGTIVGPRTRAAFAARGARW